MEVHITPKGRKYLNKLAIQHQDQLPMLAQAVEEARKGTLTGHEEGRR